MTGFALAVLPKGRWLAPFLLIPLTSCFGPAAMKQDIYFYNQAALQSETNMLVYNVGRLSERQPPHFMMLSTIAQTRTFASTASFQWSQALAAFNPLTVIQRITTRGTVTTASGKATANTWQAGPFGGSIAENPTITFAPIQGQDFFNRFESPVRDKFTYFLEAGDYKLNPEIVKTMLLLFAQRLEIFHGDKSKCKRGLYFNDFFTSEKPPFPHEYDRTGLDACLDEILANPHRPPVINGLFSLNYDEISGHVRTNTTGVVDPATLDPTIAQDKGYAWTKSGKEYVLNYAVRIPGLFDFIPDFTQPPGPPSKTYPALVFIRQAPTPVVLSYGSPKGYSWQEYKTKSNKLAYALVPDGYHIPDNSCVNIRNNSAPEEYELACEDPINHPWSTDCFPARNDILPDGYGLACDGRLLRKIDHPEDCSVSDTSNENCRKENSRRLLYTDTIAQWVWPTPSYDLYVELRNNLSVTSDEAKQACFGSKKERDNEKRDIVCGFVTFGNLLQIMQRLGDMARYCEEGRVDACRAASLAFSTTPPTGIDQWAMLGVHRYIYEPAHKEPELAARDRQIFAELYKLYQTSLVSTSQLVTAPPAITISK